jgi:hypothetical protein
LVADLNKGHNCKVAKDGATIYIIMVNFFSKMAKFFLGFLVFKFGTLGKENETLKFYIKLY